MFNINLTSPAPYHLLSYGALTGLTLWHSYVSSLVARKTLARPQLGALQSKLFPIYFSSQTVLSGICLLTSSTRLSQIIFGITAIGGLINWWAFGPWIVKLMHQRFKVEQEEGKQYNDPDISDRLKALNKKFASAHGFSVLINMAISIVLVAYPFLSPSLKI